MDVIHYRAEEAPVRSYTYKVGAKGALKGIAFIVGSLALSTRLLSDETEWHLFGAGDPFVVPSILIKLVWWSCFLLGVGALLLSRLPAQTILLERDGIAVPNILTRKYTKVLWSDVVRVDVSKQAMTIDARTQPASIAKLGMTNAEWADLQRELAARVPLTSVGGQARN